jgi:hypothetical protein
MWQDVAFPWGVALSGEPLGVAYSLDRLGDIALARGEIGPAREYYGQALQVALDHPQVALTLDVLVSQAALMAQGGHEEWAVELVVLALHHPAGHVEVQRKAQRLLDQLEPRLAPDVLAAARERGRARDLAATVEELLAELEG